MNKEEVWALYAALNDDVAYRLHALTTSDNVPDRRAYVRAVFAYVEGMTYAMKQWVRQRKAADRLSAADRAILSEESYELKDNGQTRIRPLFLPLEKNVRFAFDVAARVDGCSFRLNVGGVGWRAFQVALRVRNRLMHPKRVDDLQVSEDDVLVATSTHRWFTANFVTLLIECCEVLVADNIRLLMETRGMTWEEAEKEALSTMPPPRPVERMRADYAPWLS